MTKNIIKLNERQLQNIVSECVKRVLNERGIVYTNNLGNRIVQNTDDFDIVGKVERLYTNNSYTDYPYGMTIITPEGKRQYVSLFKDYKIEVGRTYRVKGHIADPGYIRQYCAEKIIPLN
ncbi:MAG: hypothetical protein II670_09375 [Alphaproteobacteria bacterium]|nr:hypothetical protein [Alphaproteobacteria bacterium]